MSGGHKTVAPGLVCVAVVLMGTAATLAGPSPVRVTVRPRAIDLFHSASITADGLTGSRVEVRPVGAIDRRALAYEWKPYPWRRLRLVDGTWRGALAPPPLAGIYELQLRLDHGRKLSSGRWLLRVFPPGVLSRASFPTAAGAIRNFVAHLRGNQVLVALKRWPLAGFDHRDPRLNRLFAIAYAPRGDDRQSSRLGLFITTVRNGFHGRWRVLETSTGPYD
ncbi:MAG TPA: hypothetical protein VKB43_11980 [Gaiellaceae bacterium]|nr:hypothetical protein [Gaiellaceae bacterium]